MKTIKYSLSLGLLLSLASCADDQIVDFKTAKPESMAQYEYLDAYDALKTYVDRSASPDFKLGIALSASDFLKGEVVRAMAVSNFDEMTAGNAMKYASVVGDDGTMNFSTIYSFVDEAKAAGLTIYGHTLGWHAQQNNKYLNGLIAGKEIEIDPNAANNFIKYTCGEAGQNIWDKQATYMLPAVLEIGANYTFRIDIKASEKCDLEFWPIWSASPNKDEWGGSKDLQYLGGYNIGTDWSTYEWKFDAKYTLDKLQLVFGKFGGTISFDNLVLVKDGTEDNLIDNGDFTVASTDGWGNNWNGPSFEIGMEGSGPATVEEVRRCIQVQTEDMVDAAWDSQFWIVLDPATPFNAGDTWEVRMNVRAAKEATAGTQVHKSPGDFKHWAAIGTVPFHKQWTEYTANGTIDGDMAGGYSIAFNLNDFAEANTYYFDDISFKLNGIEMIKNSSCDDDDMKDNFWMKEKRGTTGPARFIDKLVITVDGNVIPLTPEEKKDTLTWAMNNWVEGMMKATGGYVTAWDVVNEAISGGGDDGEGFYVLQSTKNVSASDAKNNFYWQDYLGNEDYVRIVVAAARKYYAENGGTEPLKLFINDYNLESDWDDNKKVKSLVHWIEKWEADGVTKIDGIGTQMHVSCFANPDTQKSKEDHVVKMFEILAASGKLIKISELDMGYTDENGNSVKTADMTEAQHKAMAEYYKFIVKKYFEIIPAAQQYGITQWCATDSPTDSGWRGGEPVGLWDANYNRKHTYAGFADGLAGK